MVQIEKVFGREIIDSRGNPAVEADVTLVGGYFGRAACPPEHRPEHMKQ